MYSRLFFFNILLFSTFLIGENLKVLKFELKINVYRCYNLQEACKTCSKSIQKIPIRKINFDN